MTLLTDQIGRRTSGREKNGGPLSAARRWIGRLVLKGKAEAGPDGRPQVAPGEDLQTDNLREEVAIAERLARIGRWRSRGAPWGWDSCSDQIVTLLGRPKAELAGGLRALLRSVAPADRGRLLRLLALSRRWADGFQCDFRVLNPDSGKLRHVRMVAEPDLNEASCLIGYHGTLQDIGERPGFVAGLRRSEAQLRAIFDSAPLPIFLKDRGGRYLLVSRAFAGRLGLTPEEIAGRRARDVLPGGYAEEMERQDLEVIEEGRFKAGDFTIDRGDRIHHFHAVKFPVPGPDGRIEQVGGIIFDITEQRETERALIDAREAAEKANEAKSRFLAAASHDLRQPLQALSLSTAALAARHPDAVALETMGLMQRAIVSMGDMLNKLLDICELDSGTIEPELADIDVGDIFARLMADFGPLALAKGLDLRIVPCRLAVRSDPELLARILSNLVSNAIRYTDRGKVLFGCRRRGSNLRFEVLDSGIGIEADKMAAIFQDYYQVDNPARDREKGLGLGLGLVDRWSRLLGHPVLARSRPGKGSIFAIEVPLSEAAPCVTPVVPLAGFTHGMLALVIEDDPAVLAAMTSLLKSWGHPFVIARTLQEAVTEAARNRDFIGLILADYRLPRGRTGAEAVEHIRCLAGERIPAVLITGSISDEVQADSQRLGAQILKKPISPADLQALMGGVLMGEAGRRGAQPAPAPAGLRA